MLMVAMLIHVLLQVYPKPNSNFLIGGEDSIRINLEYNGTPEGNEKITLSPSDSLFFMMMLGYLFQVVILQDNWS